MSFPSFHTPDAGALQLARMERLCHSVQRAKRKSPHHFVSEEIISQQMTLAFGHTALAAQLPIREITDEYRELMAKTEANTRNNSKIEDAQILAQIGILKEKIAQIRKMHFPEVSEEAIDWQIDFEEARNSSLGYLTSFDPRGMWGWEKVDKPIQPLIKHIHENPHLFHYGDSCEGHFYQHGDEHFETDNREHRALVHGYIGIGIDKTEESFRVIEKLQELVEKTDYINMIGVEQTAFASLPAVFVYGISVGIHNLPLDKKQALTFKEHKAHCNQLWNEIDAIIQANTPSPVTINWTNEATRKL